MPIITNALQKVSLSVFVIISLFSCSKDADLLSEYVITQDDNVQSIALLADDSFYMAPGQNTILMDVLNNDNFDQNLSVTIVETSTPINGTVSINEDNTLTYIIPDEETAEESSTPEESSSTNETTVEPEEDTFTYTAEVVDEETGETTKEEATVTVSNSSAITDMGEVLAFPGAEGFGKYTTGGRGGEVIHVTNLNDSGKGSLREALKTNGIRTIVFDVGGTINLSNENSLQIGSTDYNENVAEENVTIAGETAPYPGIMITGGGLDIFTSNVIVRYITIRTDVSTIESNDALRIKNWGSGGYSQKNIIIDHVSLSHGSDENMNLDADNFDTSSKNITLQYCLFGENTSQQKNLLRGNYVYNLSIINNHFTHCSDRNPLIGYGISNENVELINNIVYGGTLAISYQNTVDVIANIYRQMPTQPQRYNVISIGSQGYSNPPGGEIFVDGNFMLGPLQDGASSFNSEIEIYNNSTRQITNSLVNSWITNQIELEDSLLVHVGNSLYRDSLDTYYIDNYYNGVGGFNYNNKPSYVNTARQEGYDTDNDGMADAWEIAIFGDLSRTANGDENGDGYTNLETFLFSLIK